MKDELGSSWPQKTGGLAYMNQETEWCQRPGNLYPIHTQNQIAMS